MYNIFFKQTYTENKQKVFFLQPLCKDKKFLQFFLYSVTGTLEGNQLLASV